MSLHNSKMNAVFQISACVFEKRVREQFALNGSLSCFPDCPEDYFSNSTWHISLENIVIAPMSARFIRSGADGVTLVADLEIHLTVDGSYDEPVPVNPGFGDTAFRGQLCLDVHSRKSPSDECGLGLDIIFSHKEFKIDRESPDIPAIVTHYESYFDRTIEALLDLSKVNVSVTLVGAFGDDMIIQGEPEITCPCYVCDSLAIGLALSEGDDVDRAYFRTNYFENLLLNSENDWGLQIESNLMKKKLTKYMPSLSIAGWSIDVFRVECWSDDGYTICARDCQDEEIVDIDNNFKKLFWSGEGTDWYYHGFWNDYVNENYWKHSVWMATEKDIDFTFTCRPSSGGLPRDYSLEDCRSYWLAYADIIIDPGSDEIRLKSTVFKSGFKGYYGWYSGTTHPNLVIIDLSVDLPTVAIGSARIGDDFLMNNRVNFGSGFFTFYGKDEKTDISGSPQIDVPGSVNVIFSKAPVETQQSQGRYVCTRYTNRGELENEIVLAHFEIRNSGSGEIPLWVCSCMIEADPDAVFKIRMPENMPVALKPDEKIIVDVLMDVPMGDHKIHEGLIGIRCNDPNLPSVSIPISGINMGYASSASNCRPTPWDFNPLILEYIYETIIKEVLDDIAVVQGPFPDPPWSEDPENPCPFCGYFLDFAVSLQSGHPHFDVTDFSGSLLERSIAVDDVHFFCMPLPPSKSASVTMVPKAAGGKGIIRLNLNRVSMEGKFLCNKKIIQTVKRKSLVFVLHEEGIEIINIIKPEIPYRMNFIAIKNATKMRLHRGNLYLLTESNLLIVNIDDPYSIKVYHEIPVHKNGGFHILGDRLILFDREILRIYTLAHDRRPLWKNEFKPKERINDFYVSGGEFILFVKGGVYQFKTLESDEFDKSELLDHNQFEKLFPTFRKPVETDEAYYNFPLYGKRYIRTLYDKKGFIVLKKDVVPFIIDDKKWDNIVKRLKKDR
ncbi:MAG: hypothetical protein KKF12_07150 [Proteobacteria bacterium]|nr:hypothetical protein [Pseudomonadota bacterium]MBU4130580.1 hypothetical protein [Pseudomonadota bacterium]